MASRSRQYKTVGRMSGPGRAVLKNPTAKQKPRPASPNRPGGSDGISISMGPVDKPGVARPALRSWVTFPVTPASIPVSGAAQWSDGKMLANKGARERSTFIGPSLDTVAFEGRLEPPLYYVRGEPQVIHGVPVGNPAGFTVTSVPAAPVKGVVMESGARGGPAIYLDPHAFKDMLERIRDQGEIVRLVIGDQYGWNKLVSLREFTWRYEDPDPDVLLFNITFREDNRPTLTTAGAQKTPSKTGVYVTRNGDTLSRIAARELKDGAKWKTLLKLNSSRLAGLYRITPATAAPLGLSAKHYLLEVPYVKVGATTTRVGSEKMHAVGKGGVKRLGPDTRFVAGIRLKLK